MKRLQKVHKWGGVILLFVLFMSFNSKVEATHPMCAIDECLDSLYAARGTNNLGWIYTSISLTPDPNCPDCKIDWHYGYRYGDSLDCPNSPTVQYEFITMIVNTECAYPGTPPNGCPNPPYAGLTDEEMFQQAYFAGMKIFMEAIGYGQGSDSCGPILQSFSTVSCKKIVDTPEGKVLTECYVPRFCCLQEVQVCDSVATTTVIDAGPNQCDDDPYDSLACIATCQWTSSGGFGYKRSYSVDNSKNLDIQIFNRTISNLFEFGSEEMGDVELIIYDINGSERLRQNVELSPRVSVNIDFESGAFIYFIKAEDGRYSNGIFHIIK